MTLPDDPVGSYTLASHVLSQIIAQSNGIAPTFGDATTRMTSGDADICWQGWAAMNQFAADAGVDTFKTRVPKEGSFSFCDAYALPKGADNVDASLSWMNESLDPKVNADAAVVLVGGVTVEAAVTNLPANIAGLYK